MLCNAEHLFFRLFFWNSIPLFVKYSRIKSMRALRIFLRPFLLSLADNINDLIHCGISGKLNSREILFDRLLTCLLYNLFDYLLGCLFDCLFFCHRCTSRRFSDCIISETCVKVFFATEITESIERKSQNLCALCGFTRHSRRSSCLFFKPHNQFPVIIIKRTRAERRITALHAVNSPQQDRQILDDI